MNGMELFCLRGAELIPLLATLFATVYGLRHFFKKGKPVFLQSLTMAMASHTLGSMYHLCQSLTTDLLVEGFTPAYLGRIGFFLFLITGAYGQLDGIIDDGSAKMRPARILALLAPLCALLLFIPNAILEDVPTVTKVVYGLVWIPAGFSLYFNLKHAIVPDLDFGFIKAIRPYNLVAVLLGFAELLCLTAWDYYDPLWMAASSVLFAALCVATVITAGKGVEKWTI